jgi:epsilon-lactone hydrolase
VKDTARSYRDPDIGGFRSLLAAMAPPEGAPPPSVEERRARNDEWGGSMPWPEGWAPEPVDAGGVPAVWCRTPGAALARVILYLHGGGYVQGSSRSHGAFAAHLAQAAGGAALALDYRLAPEHPFPAAVEDAVAAYRWLLDQGVEPSRLVIAGDSAGGGLTLATALALKARGLPLPAALYAISPWADLTQGGDAYAEVGARDPMITKAGLDEMARQYLNGASAQDPLASPCFGDLRGLPPLYIQCGADEQLLSDSLRLAERAAFAEVEVRLEVWPEMIHVWPVFHQYLAAGRRAIADAGAWIAAKTA